MLDEFLLLRAKSGDKQALGKLIEKYYDVILKYCYHHTMDKEIAKDLCQDTFESVIDNLSKYHHEDKFSNYLYVVAANKCIDYFKKRKPEYVEDIEEGHLMENEFEEIVENQIEVKKLLNSLNEDLKEIIILRYFQDLKFSDIAKITKTSESLVKYKCKKAIALLQQKENMTDMSERREA